MKDTNEHMEIITGSGLIDPLKPYVTQESQAINNDLQSKLKSGYCSKDIQKQSFSVTLDQVSIATDQTIEGYWNEHCAEKQSRWWLPHRIGSQERDSLSSSVSSNYREEKSAFWKKRIVPTSSTSDISSLTLLPSATLKVGREVVKGTRKIRIYPKNVSVKEMCVELLRQQRRAYNLIIECFEEADTRPWLRNEDLDKKNLRPLVRDHVRDEVAERGGQFLSAWVDEAINSAYLTRDAVIRQRASGVAAKYKFKSRKNPVQSFIIQKLSVGFVTKNFRVTEAVPQETWGKLTRIVSENGRYYLLAQKQIETKEQSDTQARSIVSIDPGVRCFATTYSTEEAVKYGDGYFSKSVYPLLLKMDRLISLRDSEKRKDWKWHYQKKILRIRARIKDRIDDLHRRVAYDLVSKYDVILLPKYETKQMSNKEVTKKKDIKSKTVRGMLGLAQYRFQSIMKWMCKKYGKKLIICNEAYTSKTRSWDGYVHQNLKWEKTLTDGTIIVDRDINGARGIMLRAIYGLTRSSCNHDSNVAIVAG